MTHTDQACLKPSEVSGSEWSDQWQSETAERNKTAMPQLPFWRAAKRCKGASPQLQHTASRAKSAGWKLAELDISTPNESGIALFSETPWINESLQENVWFLVCYRKRKKKKNRKFYCYFANKKNFNVKYLGCQIFKRKMNAELNKDGSQQVPLF